MPSVIDTVVAQHRAAILAREAAQTAEQARAWLGVERALQAQVDALAYELANTATPTMGQLVRAERYRALRRQLDAELRHYVDYLEPRITAGQRNMITDAISHSTATVNAIATEAGTSVQFNRLPVSAVENMVGIAGDGSPLRAVLNDATSGAGDALGQQLINGTALGKNPLAVARQALRMGLGSSFTRLQAISRTEQLRVYRMATLQSYQNSNVVIGYVRRSARDNRVCPGCLMADGRRYGLNEGFDAHPQCRCYLLPILDSVPFPALETGQEWFANQSEATQRQMLGKGRFEAWQSGQATLDDMVTRRTSDTWGGALVPTPVRDLVR